MTATAPRACPPQAPEGATDSEGVRWLAMLLRQVALLIAGAVEARYGLERRRRD